MCLLWIALFWYVYNLIELFLLLIKDAPDELQFLDWEVKIQFSTNFNYTLQNFYCMNKGTLQPENFTALAWALLPNTTTTKLNITSPVDFVLKAPFETLIWNTAHIQKVVTYD